MKFVVLLTLPFFSLLAQTDDSWKVYSDSTVARIDITIDPTSLEWIYNHVDSDSEHVATLHFKNAFIDETVDSVGFRLRGNTSRESIKKSFKVAFNAFFKGRQFHGIEKLNLNGEHNDPSIIRSKLCFDLFHEIGMTASRASHATVFINGKYYGLYVSVEHIDEEFLKKNFADDSGNLWKCLYPADLKYLGNDPNAYKNVKHTETESAYELSTNEEIGDYSHLAQLIDVINNTPSSTLPDSVEQFLDVRRVLQYFAMNILVGSWDDYRFLMNNYYLYHNPSENIFTIIPYDYDNTFGVDWFSTDWANVNPYQYPIISAGVRPLADNLLAVDQYRDLFTHFLDFYSNAVFDLPLWENRIDRIKNLLTTPAEEDSFRTLDYGFTMGDFNNSYSATSYNNQHVKKGLKQFIVERTANLKQQLQYKNSIPLVYENHFAPKFLSANDSIMVTASCFGIAGIKEAIIEVNKTPLSSLQQYSMIFSPVFGSTHVEDADRWIGTIPPLAKGGHYRYRIFLKDSLDQTAYYPRYGFIELPAVSQSVSSLVINEFMADNSTIADPAGQHDDWVELYNPTDHTISLTNKYMTDKASNPTKWKFAKPNIILEPKQFLVVWCDEDTSQEGVHANFKLSASGEFIGLTDSDGVTLLDSISFGPQKQDISFGRFPDASSSWGFMLPTPLATNSQITTVKQTKNIPLHYDLSVYPNPFNPSTVISYQLPAVSNVSLKIFDLLGREVTTLVNEQQSAGIKNVTWNARNFSSGMYFCRLLTDDIVVTRKLVLMK